MNVLKSNKIGIQFATRGFIGGNKYIKNMTVVDSNESNGMYFNSNLLRHNPKSKVIRVSRSIMESCRLIDIESIKENIDKYNFDFVSMYILLDNDISGFIKVERYGSDFYFIMVSNISQYSGSEIISYNNYSFITKQFYFEKTDNPAKTDLIDYEKSIFVIQLLTYLIFGDITEKLLKPKMSVNVNSTKFLNNSKLSITFCDSLWKQRIITEGFKVRGHFRLQPIGEGRCNLKLIWIEQFDKLGYNRKATVELLQANK